MLLTFNVWTWVKTLKEIILERPDGAAIVTLIENRTNTPERTVRSDYDILFSYVSWAVFLDSTVCDVVWYDIQTEWFDLSQQNHIYIDVYDMSQIRFSWNGSFKLLVI